MATIYKEHGNWSSRFTFLLAAVGAAVAEATAVAVAPLVAAELVCLGEVSLVVDSTKVSVLNGSMLLISTRVESAVTLVD